MANRYLFLLKTNKKLIAQMFSKLHIHNNLMYFSQTPVVNKSEDH